MAEAKKFYYYNQRGGLFFDGKYRLVPKVEGLPVQCAEVEEGKETPKMKEAARNEWLRKSESKPDNAILVETEVELRKKYGVHKKVAKTTAPVTKASNARK